MLKKRLVAALPTIDGIVVQSIGFNRYLPVGRLEIAVEYLNRWGIDEIAILDLMATRTGKEPNYSGIRQCARHAQVPIAVGGGIQKVEHIRKLLSSGADKVIINQGLITHTQLVEEAANIFGNQCLIGSMDIVKMGEQYYRYDYIKRQGAISEDWLSRLEDLTKRGIGEWLINSVHCDGQYSGYDLELVKRVIERVSVPVIPLGGYGAVKHLELLFEGTEAQVAAIGNKLHFVEHSVMTIKSQLAGRGDIRLDQSYDYLAHDFDACDRLKKLDDDVLRDMLFERIEEEVI